MAWEISAAKELGEHVVKAAKIIADAIDRLAVEVEKSNEPIRQDQDFP